MSLFYVSFFCGLKIFVPDPAGTRTLSKKKSQKRVESYLTVFIFRGNLVSCFCP